MDPVSLQQLSEFLFSQLVQPGDDIEPPIFSWLGTTSQELQKKWSDRNLDINIQVQNTVDSLSEIISYFAKLPTSTDQEFSHKIGCVFQHQSRQK